jgi:hypothetical protein
MTELLSRAARFKPARYALYLVLLAMQLARDVSVSCGVWWAMVQQREAGWKRLDEMFNSQRQLGASAGESR